MDQTPEDAWAELRDHINMAALADGLGKTRAAVSAWKKVPAEMVVRVEEILNVPRTTLRPDLYAARKPGASLPWNQ